MHYIIYCVGTKCPGHRMSRHRMSRPGHRMSMAGHKIVDTFFVLFYWAQNIPRHRISQAQDVSLGTRRLKKLDFWAQNRKPGHKMSWAQNLPGTKSKMGTKSTRHIISWAQNLQAQNRGSKSLGTESPGTKSVSPDSVLLCMSDSVYDTSLEYEISFEKE